MKKKGENSGIETRGVSDYGYIESIYFRDPNGYVIELAAAVDGLAGDVFDKAAAPNALDEWQKQL